MNATWLCSVKGPKSRADEMTTTHDIVQKLWRLCDVLRGLGTVLIFSSYCSCLKRKVCSGLVVCGWGEAGPGVFTCGVGPSEGECERERGPDHEHGEPPSRASRGWQRNGVFVLITARRFANAGVPHAAHSSTFFQAELCRPTQTPSMGDCNVR